MASNVEWKAKAREPERQLALAEQIAEAPSELLEQIDTFFCVSEARLKLRWLSADRGELIHYQRPDQPRPKQSVYSLVRTDQPDALRDLLAQSLGVLGVVRMKRRLCLAGQTRIHLDEVEELGSFLEVEVVLRPGQPIQDGERIAEEMRRKLDVRADERIAAAYVDPLLGRLIFN